MVKNMELLMAYEGLGEISSSKRTQCSHHIKDQLDIIFELMNGKVPIICSSDLKVGYHSDIWMLVLNDGLDFRRTGSDQGIQVELLTVNHMLSLNLR